MAAWLELQRYSGSGKACHVKPISALEPDTAKNLLGVLFDLDDTLLDHGELTEIAYTALHRMRQAGLHLMAVTGRPSGWGEVLTRMWPVDAMVTENGIIAVVDRGRRLEVIDEVDQPTRTRRSLQRDQLVAELQERFAFLRPASDIHLRRADYTFDIGESEAVPSEDVDRVEAYARKRGARTVRSSVHLHVCFDGSDKGSGAVRALGALMGVDATTARSRFAFIGDSENDEPAFCAFKWTVGVGNLRGRPTISPGYRTVGERGQGFAEFAQRLCTLRR